MKNIKYLIIILLLPALSFGQIQIGSDINGDLIGQFTGVSVSLSSDGNIVATGAMYANTINGFSTGTVRVFELQNDDWIQLGRKIDGEGIEDNSGRVISLSADGHVLAVGAAFNNGGGSLSGHVRIHKYENGDWVQVGQDIDGVDAGDACGYSVSLSSEGNIVAIGSKFHGIQAGHVRVFENQNNNWIQIGQSIIGEAANDNAGESVALSADGSIVAVGAHRNDGNGMDSGQVRIFENLDDTWVQVGQSINGVSANSLLGNSLSLSSDGNIITMGAFENNERYVSVFKNQGGNWSQIGQNITVENSTNRFGSGIHISSSGNVVAIGDRLSGPDAEGKVYIFENQGGTWTQIVEEITGQESTNFAGYSVHLSDDAQRVAIGAPGHLSGGQVRVFDLAEPLSSKEVFNTKFSVYPNPSDEVMTFELENWNDDMQLEIFDLTGKQMMTQNFANEKITLSKSTLAEGMYFYSILSKGNQVESGKFIFL